MAKVLWEDTPIPESPFHPTSIWHTFEALKEVNRPEEIDWRTIPSMQPIAWKTGTSYGFRDAWAVGVTPEYVVGVWVGNANGEGKPGLVGAKTAGPILFDIFNLLPSTPWFTSPKQLVEAEVCRQSGHLKGRFCEDTETQLISPEGVRSDPCPYHISITLTPDERFRVYAHDPNYPQTVTKSWFVLPPVWAWFYKQQHPLYKALPPYPAGSVSQDDLPMQFIYPSSGAELYIPKQLDGSRGSICFQLAHNDPEATVYWHLDGDYLCSTTDFHEIFISPFSGNHIVTVVDNHGYTLSLRFFVNKFD